MILGFGGVGLYSWVFLVIIWLATIYYWSKATHDLPRQWGIGLIAAGGFSNLIDRPLTGGVKDYIFYPYLNLYANLADLAVTAGVIIIVIIEIKHYLKW
jgi:lipoprotein signal peptidase